MPQFGVHSEVGKLRKVLVHRPGLCLERLTPSNRHDFLFDDVVWVDRARREHDAFTDVLRDRGVEVFYLQELLAETLDVSDDARHHIIDRAVSSYTVGLSLVNELQDWLFALDSARLADVLTGGLLISELDGLDLESLNRHSLGAVLAEPDSFVLPPLPNSVFMRDSSAWLFGGVVLPPLFWHARRLEVANVSAIYRYHPMFAERRLRVLVSARRRRRAFRARRHRPRRQPRRRRPDADRQQDRARGSGRAFHRAHARARRPHPVRRPARPSASSRAACSRTAPTCTSTRCSASSTVTP